MPMVSSIYLDFYTTTLCVYRIDTIRRNTGAKPTATICVSQNNTHAQISYCLLPTLVTVRCQPALNRIWQSCGFRWRCLIKNSIYRSQKTMQFRHDYISNSRNKHGDAKFQFIDDFFHMRSFQMHMHFPLQFTHEL